MQRRQMTVRKCGLKNVLSFLFTYSQRIPAELWTRLAAVANARRAFNAPLLAIFNNMDRVGTDLLHLKQMSLE